MAIFSSLLVLRSFFRQILSKYSIRLALLKFLPDLKGHARGAKRRTRGMAVVGGSCWKKRVRVSSAGSSSGVMGKQGVVGMDGGA